MVKNAWQKYKVLIIIAGVLIVLGITTLVLYVVSARATTFPENAYVEGVNVSGKTAAEAAVLVVNDFNKKEFKIVEADNEDKILGTMSNFGFQYQLEDKLEPKIAWANFKSIFMSIFGANVNMSVDVVPDKVTKSMTTQLEAMDFVNNPNLEKTKNAYVDRSNTNFAIVPEVYGKSVDVNKLGEDILDRISDKEWSLSYEAEKYYEQPTVKKDDPKLIVEQKFCKTYLTQVITYDYFGGKYTIPIEDLGKMVLQDGDSAKIDKDQVSEFVDKLASKCNTVGSSRNFKTVKSGTITVSGGTYGYDISRSEEAAKLAEDLSAHKNIEREPVYAQTGVEAKGNGDIGDTYIELDIGAQTVYLVKNGSVQFSTEVVTGNTKSGFGTPRGVYYVFSKATNVTLKGNNADGSKYNTPVSYWMPITTGGIGFHDASWRKEFGKKIYKTDGSHGCINMPPSYASKLYNSISTGIPVVIY